MPNSEREPLSRADVAKVASLAMLELSEEALDRFRDQLDGVLDLASQLESFDVVGVEPTSHPFGLINIFREDLLEPNQDFDPGEALAAAPETEDNQYKVPPLLGETP